MFDLETLGTNPDTAPIIQIAAVAFDLEGDGPAAGIPNFEAKVSVQSNVTHPFCRRIDPDTVAWWADTDPKLLVEIMRGASSSLTAALSDLRWWVKSIRDVEGVWSNGATFDVSMLESAMKQEGTFIPWGFRAIRDVRTMAMIAEGHEACWSGGTITDREREGKKHDAVVDCLKQIRLVQQTWKLRIA